MFYTQLNVFIFYAHHVQENTFNARFMQQMRDSIGL